MSRVLALAFGTTATVLAASGHPLLAVTALAFAAAIWILLIDDNQPH